VGVFATWEHQAKPYGQATSLVNRRRVSQACTTANGVMPSSTKWRKSAEQIHELNSRRRFKPLLADGPIEARTLESRGRQFRICPENWAAIAKLGRNV